MSALFVLMIGALGVVYGDIGTSVLYTFNETFFNHHYPLEVNEVNVLGSTSLIFWTLLLVVCLKYVLIVLSCDHHGEGGTFALLAKISGLNLKGAGATALGLLLVFAASLLYGEGIITPPISVLSAIEGLKVVKPEMGAFVVPITLVIITTLFWFQNKGTGSVGTIFGCITAVWFVAIAAVGINQIRQYPQVLQAVNPVYAYGFLTTHGLHGSVMILGSVVLAMTGGEALFADLGHFGAKAIRITWLALVFPALLCNYFGQGAYLLSGQAVINNNVFFSTVPEAYRTAMIPLATAATIIASQALISGAFSLTQAAINLGLFPRLKIVHTSTDMAGQIYIPAVNWMLWAACCVLVVLFKSSSALAAAYGFAVTGVMTTTTITVCVIAIVAWRWKPAFAAMVFVIFGVIDLSYFIANAVKFMQGGYIPVAIGIVMFTGMTTWRWGRRAVAGAYTRYSTKTMEWLLDLRRRLDEVEIPDGMKSQYAPVLTTGDRQVTQLNRGVVFLTSRSIDSPDSPLPLVVRSFMKERGAIPKHTILLNIYQSNEPKVPDKERLTVVKLHQKVWGVTCRFGYTDDQNVRAILSRLEQNGDVNIPAHQWIVVSGDDKIKVAEDVGYVHGSRIRFFRLLEKLATPASDYFGLAEDTGLTEEIIPVVFGADGIVYVQLHEHEGPAGPNRV